MIKELKKYIDKIDEQLDSKKNKNIEELKKEHLIKIQIFQHERLVSLIVTLFFALFTVVSFLLSATSIIFFIVTTILFVMLLCYLFYYFSLEKCIRKLYDQYDKMV